MIRLTALLQRNPALSPEEFEAHWRDTHAELVSSVPGIRDWVVRYEQHPRLVQPGGWTGSEGFGGMAVQWFNNLDDLMAMTQDPAYRHRIAPDELRLLDMQRSVFLVTGEPRIIIDG